MCQWNCTIVITAATPRMHHYTEHEWAPSSPFHVDNLQKLPHLPGETTTVARNYFGVATKGDRRSKNISRKETRSWLKTTTRKAYHGISFDKGGIVEGRVADHKQVQTKLYESLSVKKRTFHYKSSCASPLQYVDTNYVCSYILLPNKDQYQPFSQPYERINHTLSNMIGYKYEDRP